MERESPYLLLRLSIPTSTASEIESPRNEAESCTQTSYKVTKGLLDRFGDKRVIDSPITESGFCGLTVGAALAGLHPVVSSPSFVHQATLCEPADQGY